MWLVAARSRGGLTGAVGDPQGLGGNRVFARQSSPGYTVAGLVPGPAFAPRSLVGDLARQGAAPDLLLSGRAGPAGKRQLRAARQCREREDADRARSPDRTPTQSVMPRSSTNPGPGWPDAQQLQQRRRVAPHGKP